MYNVDVHVVLHDINKRFHEELLASLAEEPCNVHLISNSGNAGQDRFDGLAHGDAPFVCYLDDADYLSRGAITALRQVLEFSDSGGTAAACSSCVYVSEAGQQVAVGQDATKWSFWDTIHNPGYMSGLVLFRRSVVMECIHWVLEDKKYYDWLLTACCAMQGEFIRVSGAVLYSRQANFSIVGSDAAKQAIKDIAYSCTPCRKRLKLDARQPKPLRERVAQDLLPSRPSKCCGR